MLASARGLVLLSLLATIFLCCGSRDSRESCAYLSCTDPDNVIANLEKSWEMRDLAEYSDRVLYNGKETDSAGDLHSAFTLYAVGEPGNDQPTAVYGYHDEVEVAAAMFSGEAKIEGKPAVASLELSFERRGEWEDVPAGEEIMGDASPEGTRVGTFVSRLQVQLEGAGDVEGLTHDVRSLCDFYMIPVRAAGGGSEAPAEFRLWKWVDLGKPGGS